MINEEEFQRRSEFPKKFYQLLSRSLDILTKLYQCKSCYSKLEQHWIKCCLMQFFAKKLQWFSTKNSLIAASYTFCSIKIRTLTSSKFKNQTNDILKLLSLIAITDKGSLNKTLLLSIIAVLNENNLHLK